MSAEPILVVKRTRQPLDGLRRLVGKAGRRDGLFSRETREPYLVCGAIDCQPEGGGHRVVFTLRPVAALDRKAVINGKPVAIERYEDAIHWRGLLGDDWERTTPQEEERRRLQRRLAK